MGPIGFGELMAWLGEETSQRAILRKYQKSFGVTVEPSRPVEVGDIDVVAKGLTALVVGELGQDVIGFPKRNGCGLRHDEQLGQRYSGGDDTHDE